MTYYAIKDGQRVARCVQQQSPPAEPHAAIEPWVGIPPGGGRGRELRESGGALYWHDCRTLDDARSSRVAAMRNARDARINSTFWWDGSEFDSDQVSQTRLLGAVVAASAPGFSQVGWRLANNTWRQLTASDLASVYGALQTHLRNAFSDFAQREAEINAATTVSAIDAVTWE